LIAAPSSFYFLIMGLNLSHAKWHDSGIPENDPGNFERTAPGDKDEITKVHQRKKPDGVGLALAEKRY
jgi:hypothetical protein